MAESLRDLAKARARVARADRQRARRMAWWHQGVHYFFGAGAALAASAAGATGIFFDDATAAGVLGFLATAFGALQTVFRGQTYANHHWARNAGFGRLAQDYEVLVEAEEEPTKGDLEALGVRWEKLHQPPAA